MTPRPAYFIGSRWHLVSVRGGTVCGKSIPTNAEQRTIESVPKSRWCKTCIGAIALLVALADAHQEVAKNRKDAP